MNYNKIRWWRYRYFTFEYVVLCVFIFYHIYLFNILYTNKQCSPVESEWLAPYEKYINIYGEIPFKGEVLFLFSEV